MTREQRNVLAQFRNVSGRPLPLFALFAGAAVSSRADVQRVVEGLVKKGYIAESLGTARMPFYRLTEQGAEMVGLSTEPSSQRSGSAIPT